MMNHQPLISVGIPTYNRPEDLRRTLAEIAGQTYRNLDIIVSDNASPSCDTEKVVSEFMRADQRVRYFRQSANLGIHSNFQFVLDKALGDYFVWCADDDWHEPEFIQSLLDELSADETASMAFCDFDIRDEDGGLVGGQDGSQLALRTMAHRKGLVRQLRFFMLAEGRAIPHVIYGLLPMKILRGFSWTRHVQRYGEYGADVLFVFWMLGHGRLALVERRLFGCTVNNTKHYASVRRRKLGDILGLFVRRCAYLFGFIRIARGWSRLALIAVFPLKLSEMLFSAIVREPLRKLRRMPGGHG